MCHLCVGISQPLASEVIASYGEMALKLLVPRRSSGGTKAGRARQPSLMIPCEGCLAEAPKGRRRTSFPLRAIASFG